LCLTAPPARPPAQIYVDPPIRQGQTSYPFFIMEINSEDEVEDLTLNMPEYAAPSVFLEQYI
jgi:Uma2 family endonuclease